MLEGAAALRDGFPGGGGRRGVVCSRVRISSFEFALLSLTAAGGCECSARHHQMASLRSGS
jgi:hypothetical protein